MPKVADQRSVLSVYLVGMRAAGSINNSHSAQDRTLATIQGTYSSTMLFLGTVPPASLWDLSVGLRGSL